MWGSAEPPELGKFLYDMQAPISGRFTDIPLFENRDRRVIDPETGEDRSGPFWHSTDDDFTFYYKIVKGLHVFIGDTPDDRTLMEKVPLHTVTIPAEALVNRCPVRIPVDRPAPHNIAQLGDHKVTAVCSPGSNTVTILTTTKRNGRIETLEFNNDGRQRYAADGDWIEYFQTSEFPIHVKHEDGGKRLEHTFTRC